MQLNNEEGGEKRRSLITWAFPSFIFHFSPSTLFSLPAALYLHQLFLCFFQSLLGFLRGCWSPCHALQRCPGLASVKHALQHAVMDESVSWPRV